MLHRVQAKAASDLQTLGASFPPWVRFAAVTVAVGGAYFLAARLSLALLTKPDGVAVFWPAAGVASGALIGLGRTARIPVVIGAMAATLVANTLGDRSLASASVFAVCNAGEAVLVAALVDRLSGSSYALVGLRRVLGLIAAALIGTAVSGIGGTFGYVWFHQSSASALTIWHHWFTSDAIGIIAVAPLLIGLVFAARDRPMRGEIVEGVAALAVLTALCALFISYQRAAWARELTIASIVPLLLWISARCRPFFTAAAIFIVALTIVWATTFGIGIFGDPTVPTAERILSAQASILAFSLCGLVLAALFAERRQNMESLARNEVRMQDALRAGEVTAFDWDAQLHRATRGAARMLHRSWVSGRARRSRARISSHVCIPTTAGISRRACIGHRSGESVLLHDVPLPAARRRGSMARGNRDGGVRRGRMDDPHQRPHPRHHAAQAGRGGAGWRRRKAAEVADRAKSAFLAGRRATTCANRCRP